MKRLDAGYRLYYRGKCSLIFEDDEEIQVQVTSGSTDYLVSIVDGVARCNTCEDYEFRFQREGNSKNGSFLCKHCYAALFYIAEIRGVKGSQATFKVETKQAMVNK